jgi:hypothetical protein
MLVLDANILIYAFREELPQHMIVRDWLLRSLRGRQSIGVPTLAEIAFLRLTTKTLGPLTAAPWQTAWDFLTALYGHRAARRVQPGKRHPEILDHLARQYRLRGDAIVDGWLAAFALERDATLVSADHGFARFKELKWLNPINPGDNRINFDIST